MTINGNLIVKGSGSGELRLANNTSVNHTVGGSVMITGGILVGSQGSANVTVNIGANFEMSSGSYKAANSTGVPTLNFSGSGDLNISGGSVLNSNHFVTVSSLSTLNLLSNFAINTNTLSISGTLNCNTNTISGTGTVSVVDGGSLRIGSTNSSGAITGNITTSGGVTLNSGSTVEFNGVAAQSVSARTFSGLKINNSSGVSLVGDVTVNGTLALTSGKLTLNSKVLTLGSSASIADTSSTRYIVTSSTDSLVRKSIGNSGARFPVGSSSYNPVTIKTTGSLVGDFSARVTDGISPAGNNTSHAVQRTWNLSMTNESGSGSIVFTPQWLGSEEGGDFLRADPAAWKWNGVKWERTNSLSGLVTGSDPYSVDVVVTELSPGPWTIANNNSALPIQLASFVGTVLSANSVQLNWTTLSEINNFGFYVERRTETDLTFTTLPNSFVPGHGTTNVPHHYTYVDNTALPGTWFYRLRQVDLDGAIHYTEPIHIDLLTSVPESAPVEFALYQNYPNPFNPTTQIRFTVEATGHTRLTVYNLLGQKIATLFDAIAEAGKYHVVSFDANAVASGLYLYKLENAGKSIVKKMLVAR